MVRAKQEENLQSLLARFRLVGHFNGSRKLAHQLVQHVADVGFQWIAAGFRQLWDVLR
jgi:hypothetical protein